MNKQTPYWAGIRKDRFVNHDVFQAAQEEVTPDHFPGYDYVIGPFSTKSEAKERAASEKNHTEMFRDPFCNGGKGR